LERRKLKYPLGKRALNNRLATVADFDSKAELNGIYFQFEMELCTPMFFGSLIPKIALIFSFSGPGGNN
jgi:hypothetical protein